MSIRLQHLREAASFLATFTGRVGELVVDTTNNRLIVHDGVTAGGWPAAKLSEVPALSALGIAAQGANGSKVQVGTLEGTINCSGASSASTIQIPNRAIVLAVSTFVTTAITGASSYNVDATTAPGGGAGSTSGQFGASLGISAGSNNVGVIGPTAWYAPSTITLTANGSNFTGGQVRVAIQYLLCGAPTS